jgi:hypothetical protein
VTPRGLNNNWHQTGKKRNGKRETRTHRQSVKLTEAGRFVYCTARFGTHVHYH